MTASHSLSFSRICRPTIGCDAEACRNGSRAVLDNPRHSCAAILRRCWVKMVFTTPAFIPKLPFDPPDSVSIFDFVFGERFGRPPLAESPPPYIDGLTGKAYSTIEVKDRVEWLARALKEDLGWDPRQGTERDKVAGVFAVNTVGALKSCCVGSIRLSRKVGVGLT